MYSTSSSPATPAPRKRTTRTPTTNRLDLVRPRRRHVRDSVYGDSWACWPNYKRRKQASVSLHLESATSGKKMTGFSLYPVPATPPARRRRFDHQLQHNPDSLALKPSDHGGVLHTGRGLFPPLPEEIPSDLVPAPLRVRKARTNETQSASSESSPSRSDCSMSVTQVSARNSIYQAHESRKRFSQNRASSLPVRRTESRLSRFRSRPGLKSHRHQRSASTNDGSSQWFDVEEGMVDRKRLSTYLGGVLGSSFQVSLLDQIPDSHQELVTLENIYPVTSRSHPLKLNPPSPQRLPSPCTSLECECSPGRILCQDKSSPEFKIFKRWPVLRKTQVSVSSTGCRMHVARGQLDQSPPKPRTPPLREIALSTSPPELLYDTLDNGDDLDWSVVKSSPQDTDVFSSSASKNRQSRIITRDARLFKRDIARISISTTRTLQSPLSNKPAARGRRQQTPSDADLSSHSSCSSFDFDFDFDSARHFQRAPSSTSRIIPSRVLHRRFRQSPSPMPIPVPIPGPTRRPSSPLLYDGIPRVNIASVARSMPTKPTLINHKKSQSPARYAREQTQVSLQEEVGDVYTRVQIRQPPRISNLRKDSKSQQQIRTVDHRHKRNVQWDLAYVPEHGRALSRVTSDGSPVLGQSRYTTFR